MSANASNSASDPGNKMDKTRSTLLFVLCLSWLALAIVLAASATEHHLSPWLSIWRIVPPLVCSGAVSLSLLSSRMVVGIFGKIEHVEIHSPELIERICKRYQSESNQLTALGFDQLFFFGEAFSIFRLLLGLPALVVLQYWKNKVPVALFEGTKILVGKPVYGAKDKTAYGSPGLRGITIRTAFRDGSLLLTRNYVNNLQYPPDVRVQCVSSLSAIWDRHKQSIQTIASDMNPVDRQNSFQFYSEMERRIVPVR